MTVTCTSYAILLPILRAPHATQRRISSITVIHRINTSTGGRGSQGGRNASTASGTRLLIRQPTVIAVH